MPEDDKICAMLSDDEKIVSGLKTGTLNCPKGFSWDDLFEHHFAPCIICMMGNIETELKEIRKTLRHSPE